MVKTSTFNFFHFNNKYPNTMSFHNHYKDVFGYLNRNEKKVSDKAVNNVIGFAKSIGVMNSGLIQDAEYNFN